MRAEKVTSLRDAIARFVRDGDRVSAACGLEARIPFAAGHEIVRQGRKHLTLVGPISDALYDQLIGCGCVDAIEAAWVGNVGSGLGYNFRRALESGAIRMTDYTNLTLALGLRAAAEGVPFAVTRSIAGTGMTEQTAAFRTIADPFGGEEMTAVRAIALDVAIVHAQYCDRDGNAQILGNLGTTLESVRAAKRVIVTTDALVERDELDMPNLANIPGLLVDAVVHVPNGAHPAPVPYRAERDHAFFDAYAEASRTEAGFAAWRAAWIDGVADRRAYCAKLGNDRLAALKAQA